MSEYDQLVDKILDMRSDLTREMIDEKVREKKEKIGAGYLTDHGALFLIASDLGISIAEPLANKITLKDLYAGAKDISLVARVMNMSPARQLIKKDGSPLQLRIVTVYDADSATVVKLWNEKANLPAFQDLKPGDLVKITGGYIKSDIDGSLSINMGSGSDLEASSEESQIPPVDSMAKDVSDLKDGDRNIVVRGVTTGRIYSMHYTNSKGQPGKALKMRLSGRDGNAMPVVVWGQDESGLPAAIGESAPATLFGVKVRHGNQELEIHGDSATAVHIEGKNPEQMQMRMLAISASNEGGRMILGISSDGHIYKIVDALNHTETYNEGDVIECMPTRIRGNKMDLETGSYVRRLDDSGSVPSLAQAKTRIESIKPDQTYCLDVIVLRAPERNEVQTKSGRVVSLTKAFVEDGTGQIWLNGWREQADDLDRWEQGNIITIIGADARAGFEGRPELTLTEFSKITLNN